MMTLGGNLDLHVTVLDSSPMGKDPKPPKPGCGVSCCCCCCCGGCPPVPTAGATDGS
jgi:hypothetical protein